MTGHTNTRPPGTRSGLPRQQPVNEDMFIVRVRGWVAYATLRHNINGEEENTNLEQSE